MKVYSIVKFKQQLNLNFFKHKCLFYVNLKNKTPLCVPKKNVDSHTYDL